MFEPLGVLGSHQTTDTPLDGCPAGCGRTQRYFLAAGWTHCGRPGLTAAAPESNRGGILVGDHRLPLRGGALTASLDRAIRRSWAGVMPWHRV